MSQNSLNLSWIRRHLQKENINQLTCQKRNISVDIPVVSNNLRYYLSFGHDKGMSMSTCLHTEVNLVPDLFVFYAMQTPLLSLSIQTGLLWQWMTGSWYDSTSRLALRLHWYTYLCSSCFYNWPRGAQSWMRRRGRRRPRLEWWCNRCWNIEPPPDYHNPVLRRKMRRRRFYRQTWRFKCKKSLLLRNRCDICYIQSHSQPKTIKNI